MSTPHLGEFFAALLNSAIERCERGEPASLRLEIGRLTYLTFGYSERAWLDQMAEEAHDRIAELREARRMQRKGLDLDDEDDDDDEHEMEVIVVRD